MTQDDCWSFSHYIRIPGRFQVEGEERGRSHIPLTVSPSVKALSQRLYATTSVPKQLVTCSCKKA